MDLPVYPQFRTIDRPYLQGGVRWHSSQDTLKMSRKGHLQRAEMKRRDVLAGSPLCQQS